MMPSIPRASVLALILLPACATARLEPPAGLEAAPRLDVRGREGWRPMRKVAFGEFATDVVDREERDRSPWWRAAGVDVDDHRMRWDFALLQDDSLAWRVDCSGTATSRALTGRTWRVELQRRDEVVCGFFRAGQDRPEWTARLEAKDAPLAGWLRRGDTAWRIESVTDRGVPGMGVDGASGYRIASGDAAIALVQTAGQGSVWLAPALPPAERSIVAALAAALLLRVEPEFETGD